MHKPAGGIRSKNVTNKPVKTGAGPRAVSTQYVSQIGGSRGNRVQEAVEGGGSKVLKNVRADVYKPPNFAPIALGNTLVNNIGQGGPGKGRVLYGQSGLQGQHGKANPGNPRPDGPLFPGWPAKR